MNRRTVSQRKNPPQRFADVKVNIFHSTCLNNVGENLYRSIENQECIVSYCREQGVRGARGVKITQRGTPSLRQPPALCAGSGGGYSSRTFVRNVLYVQYVHTVLPYVGLVL